MEYPEMSILNDSQGGATQTHVDRMTGGPRILHIINKIDTPTKNPTTPNDHYSELCADEAHSKVHIDQLQL